MRHSLPAGIKDGGFTLTEMIVSLAILSIVALAVTAAVMFGTNMMWRQRAQTNADMLSGMLCESIEDALGSASSATVSAGGRSLSVTTASSTSYRASGTYTIATEDGEVWISKPSTGQKYSLVPDGSYVDGETAECSFSADAESGEVSFSVTIRNADGDSMGQTVKTVSVEEVSGSGVAL